MAEYTVKFLIETLQGAYDPDEIIVATWFTKADVEAVLDDEGWDATPEDVWHSVSSSVGSSVDYAESEINSEMFGFVESYVMKGER
jgi:regulatory protein YycI of two-component signal transduction system YycFG